MSSDLAFTLTCCLNIPEQVKSMTTAQHRPAQPLGAMQLNVLKPARLIAKDDWLTLHLPEGSLLGQAPAAVLDKQMSALLTSQTEALTFCREPLDCRSSLILFPDRWLIKITVVGLDLSVRHSACFASTHLQVICRLSHLTRAHLGTMKPLCFGVTGKGAPSCPIYSSSGSGESARRKQTEPFGRLS